jgi:cystathionine beta-lyase
MSITEYNFTSCPNRRGYGSLKWEKYTDPEVLPLWVADMDFETAPERVAALQARLDHGVFGYTVPHAEPIDAVLHYLERAHGYSAKAAWLNFLPGLVPAINLCCHAFTQADESVMTVTPVYPPFLTAPDYAKRELIGAPLCLDANDQWTLDFGAMEAAVRPNTRLFILCSPHNPVGRVFKREELESLGEFCERHDLILISDEIHCDLIFDTEVEHIVTATVNEAIAARTITLMAPSKTYNLPGLACAFSIIKNHELRQQFNQTIRGIITEVNCFGYAGCAAAYNHGEAWRLALLETLRDNYNTLSAFLASEVPQIVFRPMEATYLAWLDVRGLELDQPARFFEKNGVGLSCGEPFGGTGHLRLNFGCPKTCLEEGLERMARAIQSS